jgi:hypothetical protein
MHKTAKATLVGHFYTSYITAKLPFYANTYKARIHQY